MASTICSQRSFARDLCDFWHLPDGPFAALRPASRSAGPLNAAGAALLGLPAGIPVSTGAADSACAAYAMAGLDERIVSISFGSSAVILGASAAPRLDPKPRYLLTPHVRARWYGREMDLLASGTGYRWLSALRTWRRGYRPATPRNRRRALTAFSSHRISGAVSRAPCGIPGCAAPCRAVLRHGRADIARAYLEGVFFEVKRCIEVLAETGAIDSVRVGGKDRRRAGEPQDALRHTRPPGAVCAERSPAALGAARLARRLLGAEARGWAGPDGDAPCAATPDPSVAGIYKSLIRGVSDAGRGMRVIRVATRRGARLRSGRSRRGGGSRQTRAGARAADGRDALSVCTPSSCAGRAPAPRASRRRVFSISTSTAASRPKSRAAIASLHPPASASDPCTSPTTRVNLLNGAAADLDAECGVTSGRSPPAAGWICAS